MPALFSFDSYESHTPTVLLYGKHDELLKAVIESFKSRFNVIVLCQENQQTGARDNVYYISKESYDLIKNITNTIDYALFFLGPRTKEVATLLQKKIKSDNAKILYIAPKDLWTDIDRLASSIFKETHSLLIFLGDIISEKNTHLSNDLTKFINQSLQEKVARLNGNDLDPVFPIGLKDAVRGIHQCMFGHTGQNAPYLLFYTHPQTYISAIHLLKRIEPDLQISIDAEPITKKNSPFTHIENYIKREYGRKPISLEKYLDGFEKTVFLLSEKIDHTQLIEKSAISKFSVAKIKHKSLRLHFQFWSNSILLGMFGFILIQALFLGIGSLYSYSALKNYKTKNYDRIMSDIQKSKFFFSLGKPLLQTITPVLGRISPSFKNNTEIMDSVASFQKDMYKVTFRGGDFPAIDTKKMVNLIASINSIYSQIQKNQAEGAAFYQVPKEFSSFINLLPIAPDLLGMQKPKTYLLLFQDNGELRPTGGFIGSVGEVSVVNGMFSNITINDVYNIDGQLKTPIEPNYIIRRYITRYQFLRDSNFNPNFEYSASTSAMLYNMSARRQVDGVVAINFEAIRRIIQAIGPLTLPGYAATITDKNAFEFLQNTIHSNSAAGSQEKKNILTALKNAIVVQLNQQPKLYQKILALIPSLLAEKHVMVAMQNKSLENIFSANGLSGNNIDYRDKSKIIPDVFSINEANIGANKASSAVNRKVLYSVSLSSRKNILSRATLTLRNSSREDYKTYIRVLAPSQSKIINIRVNGIKQLIIPPVTDPKIYENKNFKPSKGFEVDNSEEGGYHFFGFVTTVPKQTQQILEVEYESGIQVPSQAAYTYSLLYFKQPGTENYPFTLDLQYDSAYRPQNNGVAAGDNTATTQKTIDSDKEITVRFVKQ